MNDISGLHQDFHNTGDVQFMSEDEILDLQNNLFLNHIKHTVTNSPFYSRLFKENSINISDIRTVSDIARIPFTYKSHLNQNNKEFLAVAKEDIVDICLTSATTGNIPTIHEQTLSDLHRLAYNEEVAFSMAGLTKKDTILNCAALDRCFMAGLAYFLGGTKLNARMVRSGAGTTAQTWHILETADPSAIVGVPSFMRKIADYAIENKKKPADTGVKKLIAIGEPTRDAHLNLLPGAAALESLWDAKIYSTYASTELATTFCECSERCGGHVRPELIMVEIVDEKGEPLAHGEKGEVVVTPLGITGMPLIRFKTGDMAFLMDKKCRCGRTTKRISPILGRKNQMLKYKGTTVFPGTILSALEGKDFFYGGYIEARMNPDGTDHIKLIAALKNNTHNMAIDKIREILQAGARVVPDIEFISLDELNKRIYQPGKRKRLEFMDLRKNS